MIFRIAQGALKGKKEPAWRKHVDPGVYVGDVVHVGPINLNFTDPDPLHFHRPACVLVEIPVQGLATDCHTLIVGHVQGGSGHSGIYVGWIQRQYLHTLAIIDGHARVGCAKIHPDNHVSLLQRRVKGAGRYRLLNTQNPNPP